MRNIIPAMIQDYRNLLSQKALLANADLCLKYRNKTKNVRIPLCVYILRSLIHSKKNPKNIGRGVGVTVPAVFYFFDFTGKLIQSQLEKLKIFF